MNTCRERSKGECGQVTQVFTLADQFRLQTGVIGQPFEGVVVNVKPVERFRNVAGVFELKFDLPVMNIIKVKQDRAILMFQKINQVRGIEDDLPSRIH